MKTKKQSWPTGLCENGEAGEDDRSDGGLPDSMNAEKIGVKNNSSFGVRTQCVAAAEKI